jgi:uncharacterized membrane protein YbhN (UPF0104 family)
MNWKTAAKWLWVSAIITFALYYGWPRRSELLIAIETLGWPLLYFAFFLIVMAKLGLVVNMRFACKKFGISLGWWDAFQIYNHTQLAKYVPGSIWQFVGRIAIFNSRGYGGRTIRDALVAEHLWVILVAGSLGIYPLLLSINTFVDLLDQSGLLIGHWHNVRAWNSVLVGLASTAALMAAWRWMSELQRLLHWFILLMPSWQVLVVLVVTWTLFGASLWVSIQPFVETFAPFIHVVGLYGLAYVIGFLVPFAPAGLGIREAVLVLGLWSWVSADIALLLAGVNRLVYFLAELVLAAAGIFKLRPKFQR